MRILKWVKKWAWDIWFDVPPIKEDSAMYLTHEERIEKLRERIRR